MNINKEDNIKADTSNEVCKGCGWQCRINELSCNKGRRLNGVPEVVASTPIKRHSANPKTERFLRRLNRSDNE